MERLWLGNQVAVPSTSSAYILQKGAEMMSLIKAPFKRKSMPLTTATAIPSTPEKTPRTKRASSATRSLCSLAASVNSLSDGSPKGSRVVVVHNSFAADVVAADSTNPIVIIDGEEVVMRTKKTLADFDTIEMDDHDAFPEELANHSKNNLLTISSLELDQSLIDAEEKDAKETGGTEQGDHKFTSDEESKPDDQSMSSEKVARLKKKFRTKVLNIGNQIKETQQISSENSNEMANKMMKYFSKTDTFENDKLISDDAISSKMNSPVHQSTTTISPTGAKRKQKSKKSRVKANNTSQLRDDDDLGGGHPRGSAQKHKSIRNVLFSSFRSYSKSPSSNPDNIEISKNAPIENEYLQPIQGVSKSRGPKVKATMLFKKNIKSKFSRLNIGKDVEKWKTCKSCNKKCRKVHPSRTVLDFKKEFATGDLFESEFCICTSSISIRNFNDEYFEEIDDDDEKSHIKNHLYCDIDGVSTKQVTGRCTGQAHTEELMQIFILSLSPFLLCRV